MYMNLTNRMLKERQKSIYGMIPFIKSSKPGKNQIILLRNPNIDGKTIKKMTNMTISKVKVVISTGAIPKVLALFYFLIWVLVTQVFTL